ncbi:DUF2577 family protein [Lysinibacillus capsici]|uniref:DUF2577 family protein n=1 Tax=Lysinibacillus capsici TaxID=2115968 RepID=UPI000E20850B|nr:DUF2577 family protein [Lysinibacillus capsici]RDV27787.1 hypothetical protein C7B89_19610 [Lysinibacillus capsici]
MMEGTGASRLYQLLGGNSSPSGVDIKRAVIKSLPPEISVQVDGDSIDTPSEGIIVAEHLLEHKRTISFTGGTVSGQVQDTYTGGGDLRSLEIIDGELTFKCDLKVDDPVIVAVANDGQMIYVLDKAVV